MIYYDDNIGKNIKEVRIKKGLSQNNLSNICDISNTTLSAYENGKKIPNLVTIAKIAKSLGVSIDSLYYGNENEYFIKSESNNAKKIVNSIELLFDLNVIDSYITFNEYSNGIFGDYIEIHNFAYPIKRLINGFIEIESNKETYDCAENAKKILKESVSKQINEYIKNTND